MLSTFTQNAELVLLYAGLSILMLAIGVFWFDIVMTRGYNLRKELYEDDNQAAGLVVANFIIALVLVIAAVFLGDQQAAHVTQDIVLSSLYFALALVLLTVIRSAYKLFMKLFFKVDIDAEVFEQDNVAAARVEGAVYLAMGLILAACVY
ncbi:MAG: DUF350 domain-containing protein [Proteobacteria bacterium]|nr:DUF350 domain-containing protein [Pseudomonadota bacterium]